MLWFLLAISVPFFYLIGLISFLRWIFGQKGQTNLASREQFLQAAIADLTAQVSKNPNKKLSKQLEEYIKELSTYQIPAVPSPEVSLALQNPNDTPIVAVPSATTVLTEQVVPTEAVVSNPTPSTPPKESVDLGKVWDNWYSDNSINLLLYIGAFLIIASASIFVGFNWATLNGSIKALVLTLLNVAFFGFGFWFYNTSKIKTAGATFIAIGALLIPFSGLSWYNFVLGPDGFSPNIVWLITSIIAASVYFSLAYYIKHPFYTYIAGFGGLSTLLAGVNTLSLSQEFYILAGIVFAFLLLLATRLFNKPTEETRKIFTKPLSISANIIMPLFLLWGFSLASLEGSLYSIEVVLASLIATLYYLVAYSFDRQKNFLVASEILSLVFLFLTGKYLTFQTNYLLNGVEVVIFVYLATSLLIKERYPKEAKALALGSQIAFPAALIGQIATNSFFDGFTLPLVLSSLFASVFYALSYLVYRQRTFIFITEFVSLVFVSLTGKYLHWQNSYILNLLEAILVGYIVVSFSLKKRYFEPSRALALGSQIALPLVLVLQFLVNGSINSFTLPLTISSVLATVYYSISYFYYRELGFLYASEFLAAITVFVGGRWLGMPSASLLLLIELLAIVYLGAFYKLRKVFVEEAKTFFTSANILIPTLVAFLVLISSQGGSFYTKELSIGAVLAVLFYLASYVVSENIYSLVAAEIVLPIAAFVVGQHFGLENLKISYLVELIASAYIPVAYFLKGSRRLASDTLLVTSLSFATLVFVFSVPNFAALHVTIFAAWAALLGLAAVYVKREVLFLYFNIIFIGISTYWYFGKLLSLESRPYLIGLAYVAISVIFYALAIYLKNKVSEKFSFAFIYAALFNIIIGSLFTATEAKYFAIANLTAAVLTLDAAIRFGKNQMLYLSNALFYLSTWSVLRTFEVKLIYYPFAFSALAYLFYSVSFALPKKLEQIYRFTGLVGVGVNALVFGIFGHSASNSTYYDYNTNRYISDNAYAGLERNALISSYAATLLYSVEAYFNKINFFGYFASAVGMLTYLWQVNYLGIHETQSYTLPLGLYFMALAYLQKRASRPAYKDILDYTGLAFLLLPTLWQSFGAEHTALYALLLGVEGIILILVGISLTYKNYLYLGISALVLAIISQTYVAITSLPRWIVVGAVGLIFLAAAIYLLIRRQEEPKVKAPPKLT
ncbi:MAG TPA: hypothetical protein VLE47_04660 [Candidatus Saccharimonadales bacterium]|nr:hypothetical protein [Candidatus Saccharimonadales bacterium]